MAQVKSNAKLKTLPAEALEEMWRFRHPEEGGKVISYEEILVALPKMYNITSSLGALSEFYSWLTLKREMEEALARAEQAKLEILLANPDATPEYLQAAGQIFFTSQTMQNGDVRSFVALATLGLKQKQVDQDERKLKLIESKAKRLDDLEAKAKELKAGGGLTPETLEMLEKQLKIL